MAIELKMVEKDTVEHPVDPGTEVLFTVIIGNAQKGASRIEDENENLIKKGRIKDFSLGNADDLKGKIYTVFTNVLDVNDASNDVLITHSFSNKAIDYHYNDDKVPEKGILSLKVKYKFV
jgi:hypothetical protein